MDFQEQAKYRVAIGLAFKPGTPINKSDLFAGRQQQIIDMLSAVTQTGQHIIIFGERGVGKTSLSRVLSDFLVSAGFDCIFPDNINCDGTDNFARIWLKVFREINALLNIQGRESSRHMTLDDDELYYETPDDIRYALNQLRKPAVIILDEVDRITDKETTALLADMIKNLSDHASSITVVLIGIADSVDGLIQEHHSIERSLVQVHLPRMPTSELRQIIDKGMHETGMTIEEDATDLIVRLSAGLPHYTHTLASKAATRAITQDRTHITTDDMQAALAQAVNTPGSLLTAYERATMSSRKTIYPEVLLACALAAKTDLGYFTAASIRQPLEAIRKRVCMIPSFAGNLDALCSEERGMVLAKSGGPRRFRYRFDNPLLQPFVIIHGLAKGLLSVDMLSETA